MTAVSRSNRAAAAALVAKMRLAAGIVPVTEAKTQLPAHVDDEFAGVDPDEIDLYNLQRLAAAIARDAERDRPSTEFVQEEVHVYPDGRVYRRRTQIRTIR